MARIEMRGITKSFGALNAIDNLNLDVEDGELVSLLGPSGCGKTTTMRLIAGFELPNAGSIRFDDEIANGIPTRDRNIGMVFQNYVLFPNMNVEENVGFGLLVAGKAKSEIKEKVRHLLDLVNLRGLEERFPKQLSGGQQQRVALARALARSPRILLLDEPMSALDAKIRVQLRNEIRRIQTELRVTTVYVTHDQEEALSISDRVIVMNKGRIEQVGNPGEVYHAPRTTFVANFVGAINMFEVKGIDPPAGNVVFAETLLKTPPYDPALAGKTFIVALRPEAINVSRAGDDREPGQEADNRISGTVTLLNFLGPTLRLSVQAHGQTILVDLPSKATGYLNIGDQVNLRFDRNGCRIIPDNA